MRNIVERKYCSTKAGRENVAVDEYIYIPHFSVDTLMTHPKASDNSKSYIT